MAYIAEVNVNKKTGNRQIMIEKRGDYCDVVDEEYGMIHNASYDKFKRGTLTNKNAGVKTREFGNKPATLTNPKDIIEYHRTQTFENLLYELSRKGMCAVIRPCGFGKTIMAFKLCQYYKKSLFVYPGSAPEHLQKFADKINGSKKVKGREIKFMTYHALVRLTDEEILALDYDLIFFDEMHCLGGDETSKVAQKIVMAHKGYTKFVGATATNNRTDGRDVLSYIFNNVQVYPYTIKDALNDGVMKAPKYYYSTYNIYEYVQNIGKSKMHRNLSREETEKILGIINTQKFDAHKLDIPIKEVYKNVTEDDYLKFIVFCNSIDSKHDDKSMDAIAPEIIIALQKAFPKHKINAVKFSSRSYPDRAEDMTNSVTKQFCKDVEAVKNMPEVKGQIDVIISCERLTYGYHDDKVSGTFLYRLTRSNLKYMQMIGRGFDCDNNKQAIIFDIVDNAHITPLVNKLKPQYVEIDGVVKRDPTFEEVYESIKHKRNVKYWYKPKKKSKKTTSKHEEETSTQPEDEPLESEMPKDDSLVTETACTPPEKNEPVTSLNEDISSTPDKNDAVQATPEPNNECEDNSVQSSAQDTDLEEDDDWITAIKKEQERLEKERKRLEEEHQRQKDRAKESFPNVAAMPKHTAKIETKVKDELADKTSLECRSFGHEDCLIDLEASDIRKSRLEIEDLIERMYVIPEKALLEDTAKKYTAVEGCVWITNENMLLGNDELSVHRRKILKAVAENADIEPKHLVEYMLKESA